MTTMKSDTGESIMCQRGEAATSQGSPRIARKRQKVEEARKDPTLEASKGASPADTLIWDLTS